MDPLFESHERRLRSSLDCRTRSSAVPEPTVRLTPLIHPFVVRYQRALSGLFIVYSHNEARVYKENPNFVDCSVMLWAALLSYYAKP